MELFRNDGAQQLVAPWLEQKKAGLNKLDKSTRALTQKLLAAMQYTYYYGYQGDDNSGEAEEYFTKLIDKGEVTSIADLFAGERKKALAYLLGDKQTEKFLKWLQIKPLLIYQRDYYRRSLRTTNVRLHLYTILREELKIFFALAATGLSYIEILKGSDEEEKKNLINETDRFYPAIAVEIEENNKEVIETICNILLVETTQAPITSSLFRAVFAAGNTTLYERAGRLLLAARLQEGLRQAITETMDSGRIEAFIYMLRIVRENNLQRFSSIKRAVGTWTGLFEEGDADRVSNKVLDLIWECLTDTSAVDKYAESTDAIELFIALWAKGCYEVADVEKYAEHILAEGVKHKLQVLFYFVSNMKNTAIQHRICSKALMKYPDDDSLLVGYLEGIMVNWRIGGYDWNTRTLNDFFASEQEAMAAWDQLKNIADRIKKEQVYSPYIFPWYKAILKKTEALSRMAVLAGGLKNNDLIDILCGYLSDMDVYLRRDVIEHLINKPQTPVQMDSLVKAIGDRSDWVRTIAFNKVDELDLKPEHFLIIENMLHLKSGDLRENAIRLLLKQSPEALQGSIERLLAAKQAEKRLAALDILLTIKDRESCAELCTAALPLVENLPKPSSKEQILIDRLLAETRSDAPAPEASLWTTENGFGLIENDQPFEVQPIEIDKDFTFDKVFPLSAKQLLGIMKKLNDLIASNADHEYRTHYGELYLLGNSFYMCNNDPEKKEIDHYPLADTWRAFYESEIKSPVVILQLSFFLKTVWRYDGREYNKADFKNLEDDDEPYNIYSNGWKRNKFLPFITSFYGFDYGPIENEIRKLPYRPTAERIISLLFGEYQDKAHRFYTFKNVFSRLLSYIQTGEKEMNKNVLSRLLSHIRAAEKEVNTQFLLSGPLLQNKELKFSVVNNQWGAKKGERKLVTIFDHEAVSYWLSDRFWEEDKDFHDYFMLRYSCYKGLDFEKSETDYWSEHSFGIANFMKAFEMGIIPEEELIKELVVRKKAPDAFRNLVWEFRNKKSGHDNKYNRDDYPLSKNVYDKIVPRIVALELKRGDSETPATPFVKHVNEIYGLEKLVEILKALDKDTFDRGTYHPSTKKEVLSYLLKHCYPLPDDTPEKLKELLQGTNITETRLIEAAMYAPQWLELIEKYTAWKGLYSAVYYFHAHMNESHDDKTKAIIARFTPIPVEELSLGAFDIDWFKEAYKEVGEKRFDVIYEAAKYISSGNGHTRGRKFADAVNGKMDVKEVRKEIETKRNKDLLLSYSLIPINKRVKQDLPERYQYLQQFLKESKSFGAQRQDSEKKAVEIAMQNLARNAGYADVTRLVWSMETFLIKEMASYFTPKAVGGIEAWVEVDQEGKSTIKYQKDGKELKSLPAKLKKDKYIEELKAVHKKLKDQYSRSRIMLEQSMEDSTLFYTKEIAELTQNPVVWPLLSYLVFVNKDGATGFFRDGNLISADNVNVKLADHAELRIAHPIDLYTANVWHSYQKYLFDNQIKQPFKQVFRELYVKTEDEKPKTNSLRYAGHQIQPQKTVGVLKNRRWKANYEDGLQKIYYKENIVATIYAIADWFSPSDIEAPTLEWVAFYDRRNYKPIAINKIPDILFSEVMRDVDLAVSVAHAGGVDPEASHSTVEMRAAIISFTLPLFRLENVRVEGAHAFITGSLGNYNIHLGSGVIHQEAGAAINVLPIHSQHRGKIFLPFVDDDPKTAEIISKIVLFAEDEKIKDPFILEQIQKR